MEKSVPDIRKSAVSDIEKIMAVYDHARQHMRMHGNLSQWTDGYPTRDVILQDMAAGNHFSIFDKGKLAGVFTFIEGTEPTYAVIDGAWPDNQPYGTIHRIASAPATHGIADACLRFCLSYGINIRIDTHADNAPMLNWIAKRGFSYCGIIHVANGTPRMAFSLLNPKK